MALHRLTSVTIGVPNVDETAAYYTEFGLTPEPDGWGARLTGDQGSGILRSMVAADGLAVVPGDTTIEPGSQVRVILLRAV